MAITDPAFFAQLLVNGLVVGAIYALLAVGLSLIFGVLEIVNFAHGELYMLGAFVAVFAMQALGYWLTLVVAAAAMAALGFGIYDLLLSRLDGKRRVEQSILITIGVSMLLQNGALWAWTGTPRSIMLPGGLSEIHLGPVILPLLRVFAVLVAAVAFVLLFVVLHRTRLGRAMRAVAQNREAALMVGIQPKRIFRATVMLGTALCGVAGAALAPIYGATPTMGTSMLFKAFAIVVVGGMGSIGGSIVTAVLMGVLESFAGGAGSTVLQDAMAFLFMMAILFLRPQGFFGRKVRL